MNGKMFTKNRRRRQRTEDVDEREEDERPQIIISTESPPEKNVMALSYQVQENQALGQSQRITLLNKDISGCSMLPVYMNVRYLQSNKMGSSSGVSNSSA